MIKEDEDQQSPVIGNLGTQDMSRVQQKQAAQQEAPVISVPRMDNPARFQDPAGPLIPDERTFRGDPQLVQAAQRGEAPPISARRSDIDEKGLLGYTPQFNTIDDIEPQNTTKPSGTKTGQQGQNSVDTQQGSDDPVIPDSRYMEVENDRVNKLGFRKFVDRGQVNSDYNHMGIYTNLGDQAFNKAMDDKYGNANGGGFEVAPAAQLNAQSFNRRVAGRLPSGATYEYFLKPGELNGAQDYALQQKNAQQSAMPAFDGSLHSAKAMQQYEVARKQNLLNSLAEHFKDTDPDLAASMLGISRSNGVIDTPDWGTTSTKNYDDMGNVISENPMMYQKNAQGVPQVYPVSQLMPQPSQVSKTYEEALSQSLAGVKADPSKRGRALELLRTKYPNQFKEEDFQL